MAKIIKCLIVDDEPVAREILESHLQKIATFELVKSCKNAIEAFQIINESQIDLIFLDINMPEITGLSFAQSINKDIKIIFTTAYREYAVDGFNLKAVDYLLKPISFARLLQAVDKYLTENTVISEPAKTTEKPDKTDYMFVRADRKMYRVNFSEITYIESFGDYLKLNLEDKTIVTRETISSIEAKLPKNEFIRTHRSFIVSLSHIDSFTNEYIDISDHIIPISRTFKSEVLRFLEQI